MSSVNNPTQICSAVRDIIQLGHPLLRRQAATIADVTSDHVRQTIADMRLTLSQSNGVGLAAPQIAESLRIVIIASRPTPRYPYAPELAPIVMLNPSFHIVDRQQIKDWEGCLSIPGIRALVPRYAKINVHYENEQGQHHEMLLADFPARVFQHEFDHLQGQVYLDQVIDNKDIISEQEFQKLLNHESSR